MDKEAFKKLLSGVDFAELLPNIEEILSVAAPTARFLALAGSFVLLAFGLYCLMLAPKEATYQAGYRFRWGMASPEAWRYMQRVAGVVYMVLGLGLAVYMALWARDLNELPLMDMMGRACVYIALQAALALLGSLVINLLTVLRYDRKGNRRYTWLELLRG